ncbi:hypothetical protein N7471_013576 [Penicillium samsonianum]|uniref:uncharacterized protein n=1 Tax=Penicillium samsonianum TaxID=1882272 RepID=UPI002547D046|nr:uncharacterized protein N7471_013576 [Penicillium samsonianum]KAJ6118956.1 hypothetical protein N7471_013576 [Penicillium samsonianum]
MKAAQSQSDSSFPRIVTNHVMNTPTPHNELLIRVHAAGITRDENLWPELYACPSQIAGHDISGMISTTGPR